VLLDAAPHRHLHERPRHREGVEAQIALRERVEARAVHANVEPDAEPHRAGAHQRVLELGKQLGERLLPAGEQGVNVPALRHAVAVDRMVGQGVLIQHQHPFEVVGERPRRGEPSHPGPDDYRSSSDVWHVCSLRRASE